MKAQLTFSLFILILFSTVSCQTVTVSPKGSSHVYSTQPDFERSYNFFLFGIVGDHSVNVQKICKNKSVKQMQTQDTFLNGFLGIITLGIYTPRTARVWCENKNSDSLKLNSMESGI